MSHPDLGGSDERFRLVREAYEVLSDPEARAAYDRSTRAPVAPTPSQAAAPTRAPTRAPAPTRPIAEPETSNAGCVFAVAAIVGVVIIVAVAIVALVGGSNGPVSGQRASGTTAAPATNVDSFRQWQAENASIVGAVVENGQELGVALSGAIDLDEVREICTRRRRLLDGLEAAAPTPRDDVTKAINGFVSSERRAMSSCLASPPDFERLAEWGERGRTDLQTIVRATQRS